MDAEPRFGRLLVICENRPALTDVPTLAAHGSPVLPPLRIGRHVIESPVVLAPMAGITNRAFRRLCREYGNDTRARSGAPQRLREWRTGLYVSEMITTRALVERNARVDAAHRAHHDENPRSIQLYGVDPKTVAEAVTMLVAEDRADHIDLNFGCPVPKVTRKGGGAALPWKRDLFRDIVERGREGGRRDVPVTVKMRKGIDAEHLTYLEAGASPREPASAPRLPRAHRRRVLFRAGRLVGHREAQARRHRRSGLGNGDIWSAEDALRMVAETGCDGVVVGRGCLGRPWLFGDLAAAFRRLEPTASHARRGRAGVPARRAARRVLRRRGARLPRHPQARRLVPQGVPGRLRPCATPSPSSTRSHRSTSSSRRSTGRAAGEPPRGPRGRAGLARRAARGLARVAGALRHRRTIRRGRAVRLRRLPREPRDCPNRPPNGTTGARGGRRLEASDSFDDAVEPARPRQS